MSSTSIKIGLVAPGSTQDFRGARSGRASDVGTAARELPLLEMLSLTEWRRLLLETFVLLTVITVLQRCLPGVEVPGLPHPYWLPVLLASCQYGVSGGMIAAVASSLLYFFGLSAPSAAQDFYAYTRLVAVQPATWLATALVLGGLRNLHIHQSKELADQLAASRRRANDLSSGLERAAAEISQLERRIALDMSTAAALSRSFSLIDMGSRWAAARSYGELFRVATGAATFTIYLQDRDGFAPVWAIEEDTIRSTKSIEPLSATEIDAMMVEKAGREGTADVDESESVVGRHVVRVPPLDSGSKPLAIVVCDLNPSLDTSEFLRRADETSRAFATILRACPDSPSGARP